MKERAQPTGRLALHQYLGRVLEPTMLEEPIDGRVEVLDSTEPEGLVRAGYWPRFGSITREGST